MLKMIKIYQPRWYGFKGEVGIDNDDFLDSEFREGIMKAILCFELEL